MRYEKLNEWIRKYKPLLRHSHDIGSLKLSDEKIDFEASAGFE